MCEEQRITLRRLYAPQVVKLDEEPIGLEQRGINNLAYVVKSDWRAWKIDRASGRDIKVPGNRAVFDFEVADQRDQKSRGHGIDERGTALDRILLAHINCVESLRRHRL